MEQSRTKLGQFTHTVTESQPYYFIGPQQSTPPDGQLNKGAKIILDLDGGSYSRVTTEDGITAWVVSKALQPIERP